MQTVTDKRVHRLLALAVAGLLLTGCGLKGDLYIEGEEPLVPEEPAASDNDADGREPLPADDTSEAATQ